MEIIYLRERNKKIRKFFKEMFGFDRNKRRFFFEIYLN